MFFFSTPLCLIHPTFRCTATDRYNTPWYVSTHKPAPKLTGSCRTSRFGDRPRKPKTAAVPRSRSFQSTVTRAYIFGAGRGATLPRPATMKFSPRKSCCSPGSNCSFPSALWRIHFIQNEHSNELFVGISERVGLLWGVSCFVLALCNENELLCNVWPPKSGVREWYSLGFCEGFGGWMFGDRPIWERIIRVYVSVCFKRR